MAGDNNNNSSDEAKPGPSTNRAPSRSCTPEHQLPRSPSPPVLLPWYMEQQSEESGDINSPPRLSPCNTEPLPAKKKAKSSGGPSKKKVKITLSSRKMGKRKRESSPEIIYLGSKKAKARKQPSLDPSSLNPNLLAPGDMIDDQPSCSMAPESATSPFDGNGIFPPAVITHILSFLDKHQLGQVAQACSELRDFCYDPKLWTGTTATITLEQSQDPAYFEVLESLRRRDIQRINVPTYKAARLAIACIPNLKSLNVYESYVETDFSIDTTFVVPMPNLSQLSLSHCDQLNDNGMAMLCPLIKNVVDLNLYGSSITDTSILRLAMSLPNLKRLNIGACSHVTNRGISYICGVGLETGEMATGNLNLEYLEVSRNPHITDTAAKFISRKLTKLETLDLSYCSELSEKSLIYLSDIKTVKVLLLRGCRKLTVLSWDYAAYGETRLQTLDLSGCSSIGDAASILIAHKFWRLRVLKLNNTGISDLGVLVFSKILKKLKTLDLMKCKNLTLAVADSLMNMKLDFVDLTDCNQLKVYSLAEKFKFGAFKLKAFNVLLQTKHF